MHERRERPIHSRICFTDNLSNYHDIAVRSERRSPLAATLLPSRETVYRSTTANSVTRMTIPIASPQYLSLGVLFTGQYCRTSNASWKSAARRPVQSDHASIKNWRWI